jgi:hypothetical protein
MKIKVRNFPHPVLNPVTDDFQSSYFQGRISSQREEDEYLVFTVKFDLKNKKLQELIDNRKANFTVHFECISTMIRMSYSVFSSSLEVKISKNDLNKKIDVNFFILAEDRIDDYINDDTHSDFEGIYFRILKGDILAYSESQTIHIEKTPISKTNSIFKVSKDTYLKDSGIKISTMDHQIEISIPEDSYERIAKLKAFGEDCNKVLITMLYLPALIDTLFNIYLISGDVYALAGIENLDWYRTLEKKLHIMGYNISDIKPYEITQISYQLLLPSNGLPWTALENIVYKEEADAE